MFEMAVMGEGWGDLILPMVNTTPGWVAALTLIIFFGVFFSVVVGLMNLVLAVIVDFAVDARDEDAKMQGMIKDKMRKNARKKLMDLCVELDVDAGGTLTHEEFLVAYDESTQFRTMMDQLDVDREDLECVFRIIDKDHSGDVSYTEFTDLLYKMKAQNSRTLLLFIKYYAIEIRRTVGEEMDLVRTEVMTQMKANGTMIEQVGRSFGINVDVEEARLNPSGSSEALPTLPSKQPSWTTVPTMPKQLTKSGSQLKPGCPAGQGAIWEDLPGAVLPTSEVSRWRGVAPHEGDEDEKPPAKGVTTNAGTWPGAVKATEAAAGLAAAATSAELERLSAQLEEQFAALRRQLDEQLGGLVAASPLRRLDKSEAPPGIALGGEVGKLRPLACAATLEEGSTLRSLANRAGHAPSSQEAVLLPESTCSSDSEKLRGQSLSSLPPLSFQK